jgi:hypothetical protein
LAALELADRQRPGEPGHVFKQIGFESIDVEAQPLGDLFGARKGALTVGGVHPRLLRFASLGLR